MESLFQTAGSRCICPTCEAHGYRWATSFLTPSRCRSRKRSHWRNAFSGFLTCGEGVRASALIVPDLPRCCCALAESTCRVMPISKLRGLELLLSNASICKLGTCFFLVLPQKRSRTRVCTSATGSSFTTARTIIPWCRSVDLTPSHGQSCWSHAAAPSEPCLEIFLVSKNPPLSAGGMREKAGAPLAEPLSNRFARKLPRALAPAPMRQLCPIRPPPLLVSGCRKVRLLPQYAGARAA